jgi:hypothetical protein
VAPVIAAARESGLVTSTAPMLETVCNGAVTISRLSEATVHR